MKPSLVVGPANNAKLPECGIAGEPTPVNEVSPVSVQGGKLPVSKPPLTTMQPPGVPVGVGLTVEVGVGLAGVPVSARISQLPGSPKLSMVPMVSLLPTLLISTGEPSPFAAIQLCIWLGGVSSRPW